MINPLLEDLISLREAAAMCPRRRGKKPTHVSCVYRWTTVGCRGVRLEAIQVGGSRCTSREAVARFFARLTQAAQGSVEPTARTPAQRQRAIDRANRTLDDEGV